jgi:hypothetical protein
MSNSSEQIKKQITTFHLPIRVTTQLLELRKIEQEQRQAEKDKHEKFV